MFTVNVLSGIAAAAFNAGAIYGGIRAGLRKAKEDIATLKAQNTSLKRRVTRLRQYKAWSHRALSVLIAFHELHHPGEKIIEDWKEIEEGECNGG